MPPATEVEEENKKRTERIRKVAAEWNNNRRSKGEDSVIIVRASIFPSAAKRVLLWGQKFEHHKIVHKPTAAFYSHFGMNDRVTAFIHTGG